MAIAPDTRYDLRFPVLLLVLIVLQCVSNTSAFGGIINGAVGGRDDNGVFKPFDEIISKDFSFDVEIGLLEFDLATLSPTPNPSIFLNLHDSGGLLSGLSSTRVFVYSGDGAITPGDLTISTIASFDISRSFMSGGSQHDVTVAVNTIVAGGGTHAGFRFEPLGGSTWDGFGFASDNLLVFSDIPEPTVYAMIGIAGLFCSRSRLCRGTCWLAS